MSRPSYAALLKEIAMLRQQIEDLKASAIAWRDLYEESVQRCAELERIVRQLTGRTPTARRGRRGRVH